MGDRRPGVKPAAVGVALDRRQHRLGPLPGEAVLDVHHQQGRAAPEAARPPVARLPVDPLLLQRDEPVPQRHGGVAPLLRPALDASVGRQAASRAVRDRPGGSGGSRPRHRTAPWPPNPATWPGRAGAGAAGSPAPGIAPRSTGRPSRLLEGARGARWHPRRPARPGPRGCRIAPGAHAGGRSRPDGDGGRRPPVRPEAWRPRLGAGATGPRGRPGAGRRWDPPTRSPPTPPARRRPPPGTAPYSLSATPALSGTSRSPPDHSRRRSTLRPPPARPR